MPAAGPVEEGTLRLSDLGIGLLCGLIVPVMSTGCDDGGGSGEGGTTPATDGGDDDGDDGSAEGGTATSTSGAADADGTAGSTAASGEDDGPPDTDGDPAPEIECGDGVHDGPVLIDPENGGAEPVDVLTGISVIDGDLLISNTTYTSLDYLHCLTEIRGDIQIFNNYFLQDMTGADGILKVGRLPALNPTPGNPNFVDDGKGSITISGNPILPDINGFNGITQIGEQDTEAPAGMNISPQSLVIRNNPALLTITGFDNLQLIYASLIIQENDALMDIDGLQGLQGVGAAFSVTRNPSLCISSVNAVGGGLEILGEPENSTTTQNDDSC
jgi:hypothetical protein